MKLKDLTILCDMDGCLVDLHPMWLEEYDRNGGEFVRYHQCTSYDMAANVKNLGILWASLRYPLSQAPAVPGAIETINWLRSEGATVLFVTAAPTVHCLDANERKLQWLKAHFKAPQDAFYLSVPSEHKWRVRGDALIEDNPHTVSEWRRKRPKQPAFLMKAPYNPDGVTWADIRNYYETITSLHA